MPRDRKRGELRLEGASPMRLLESDERPVAAWTPEQEFASTKVGDAVKTYIKAAEDLASGKYSHLADKIPDYMRSPGNVLVAVCADGVVVRFERKGDEDRKLAVIVVQDGIAFAAALLSQNLVYIQSSEAPLPHDENFGVELKLTAHSPTQGLSHELVAARIWFQVVNSPAEQSIRPGAKPYCLLSVRNQLNLEIQGELLRDADERTPGQPFIAHSTMRLIAGWECIEVFPGLELDAWNADFAPLWAENDLLAAALIAQTQDAQLSNLDPRASARRQYGSLLIAFKALLDSDPDREQILQAFLQRNPMLLCPTHVRMWPKLALGATITDFVFRDATQEYVLVELERSTLQLFRQHGHATADLTHAHGQIVDWKRYLEDNLQTVQRELGLDGITPNPSGLLVIGRSQSLLPRDRRKLQTMMNESPKLRIMTYDDVYENAKAVIENLLGPIWDTGGSTQIYYPRAVPAGIDGAH
ncbi:MAG: hypothetical protein JWL77_6977 [Chthonomonadaceae bacterium]|nr:hypothetical protein [Chthonomonadaceae bacterium]